MAIDNPFRNLPKPALYGGIGTAVLVTGYLLYSHHRKTGSWFGGGAAPAAGAGTQTDPVTGLAYSQDNVEDPITGETYLAEAEQYGSVQTAESSVSAFGASSGGGTGIGVQPASPGLDGSSTLAGGAVTSPTYATYAAWAQAAQAGLAAVSGTTSYDGTDIGTALGAYGSSTPLTPAQQSLVRTAIAEYGPAPGNLQIIPAPVTAPAPPPAKPPASPSVPAPKVKIPADLIGQPQEAAFGIIGAAGLHPTGTPVVRGKTLIVQSVSPAEGTMVAKGSTVKLTSKVKA